METEQTSQSLAQTMRLRPFTQKSSADMDDAENPSNRGFNLRSLSRTLQRQALLIAGVATVATVAAGFQAMKIPPRYQGDFQILVEPVTNQARAVDPSTVTRTDGAVPTADAFTLDYPTQLQILQSPSMLDSIVKEVQAQYPEFTFDQLRAGLKVERFVKDDDPAPTRIIKVTYDGADSGLVQKVLKTTAERYLRYSLDDRKTRFGEGVKFIEDQLPEVQQRVDGLQDQLQQLQQQYDLIDPATQGGQLSTRINDIVTQKLDTDRALEEQKVLYTNLRNQLQQLSPEDAIKASALSEDPNFIQLQTTYNELQGQLAVESARFSENSPVVQSLNRKLKGVEDLLRARARSVTGQEPPNAGDAATSPVFQFQNSIRQGLIEQLVAANNQIGVLQVRQQKIEQARGGFERRIQQFPAIARRYTDLTRQLEVATQTLNRLLTQRESLRVQAAQTEVPWELISEPLIPRDAEGYPVAVPSKASRIVIGGALAGLLLGTLLALLLERYRNVFYTVEDLQDTMQLPVAGVIPFSRGAKQSLDFPSTFGSVEDLEDSRLGTAPFRESFSDLYSNIRLAEPAIGSVMVCSAEPGDGKTTAALYLAQTAAGAGQQVLLVDTNLRLPQIHTRLDLINSKGLSNVLATNQNPDELIQQSPLADNLYVLTAGAPMPGAARLLGSDQMKQLMERFKAKFDLVIYDTPHLFGLTDASFLTGQVDEILMVVAPNKTNRTAAERVVNKLLTVRPMGVSLVANYLKEHNSPTETYNRYSGGGAIQARREPVGTLRS